MKKKSDQKTFFKELTSNPLGDFYIDYFRNERSKPRKTGNAHILVFFSSCVKRNICKALFNFISYRTGQLQKMNKTVYFTFPFSLDN